jgi:hypothetical protein
MARVVVPPRPSGRQNPGHAASTYGDDVLLAIALLMFLVGTLLAVLTAGFAS